jgi:hypothetical protein
MGDLPDFEKRQIVCARLTEASLINTARLLGVSRAPFSRDMLAYMNHEKTTSAKRNIERKSTLTEGDRRTLRRIVLTNHSTTKYR